MAITHGLQHGGRPCLRTAVPLHRVCGCLATRGRGSPSTASPLLWRCRSSSLPGFCLTRHLLATRKMSLVEPPRVGVPPNGKKPSSAAHPCGTGSSFFLPDLVPENLKKNVKTAFLAGFVGQKKSFELRAGYWKIFCCPARPRSPGKVHYDFHQLQSSPPRVLQKQNQKPAPSA